MKKIIFDGKHAKGFNWAEWNGDESDSEIEVVETLSNLVDKTTPDVIESESECSDEESSKSIEKTPERKPIDDRVNPVVYYAIGGRYKILKFGDPNAGLNARGKRIPHKADQLACDVCCGVFCRRDAARHRRTIMHNKAIEDIQKKMKIKKLGKARGTSFTKEDGVNSLKYINSRRNKKVE